MRRGGAVGGRRWLHARLGHSDAPRATHCLSHTADVPTRATGPNLNTSTYHMRVHTWTYGYIRVHTCTMHMSFRMHMRANSITSHSPICHILCSPLIKYSYCFVHLLNSTLRCTVHFSLFISSIFYLQSSLPVALRDLETMNNILHYMPS